MGYRHASMGSPESGSRYARTENTFGPKGERFLLPGSIRSEFGQFSTQYLAPLFDQRTRTRLPEDTGHELERKIRSLSVFFCFVEDDEDSNSMNPMSNDDASGGVPTKIQQAKRRL